MIKYKVIDMCENDNLEQCEFDLMTREEIIDKILEAHYDMDFDTEEEDLVNLSMEELDDTLQGFGYTIELDTITDQLLEELAKLDAEFDPYYRYIEGNGSKYNKHRQIERRMSEIKRQLKTVQQ